MGMAGGSPQHGINRYTMYTPNTARTIQKFMESRALWDPSSSTGFRKYNHVSRTMDGFVYGDDSANDDDATGCKVVIETNNSGTLVYALSTSVDSNGMNKFHVNVATESEPHKASVYCQDVLLAQRALDGPNPNEPALTYTVNGIPFDDDDGNDTAAPTVAPTAAPTNPPTKAPAKAPVPAPTGGKPMCVDPTSKITITNKKGTKTKTQKCNKISLKKCNWKTEDGQKVFKTCPVRCEPKISEKNQAKLW